MNVEMKHPARPTRRGRVIALHCSGAGAGEWRALAEALAGRHDIEAPEHYGCESTGTWSGEHAFTLADEASRAIALIDASAGQVHLVGHSYGGAVALHAALARPDRIASIALYEPSVFHLLGQMGAMGALALAQIARVAERVYRGVLSGDYRGAAAGFVDYWNGPGAWDAMRPSAQHALVRWASKGPLEFRAVLENATPASAYRTLNAPVLILRGEHALLPSRLIAESLSQLLPAARLTVVAGAAHMGPLTHAGEVCALIRRHIAAAEESRAAVRPAAARFVAQSAQIRVYS
jgi:pimeloyl-ACP methyl ester carboxylesterase